MTRRIDIRLLAPVPAAFFVMGFCDMVGVSVTYAKEQFSWSETRAGFLPSMVFIWFLVLSLPVAVWMNRLGRRNTVLLGAAADLTGSRNGSVAVLLACALYLLGCALFVGDLQHSPGVLARHYAGRGSGRAQSDLRVQTFTGSTTCSGDSCSPSICRSRMRSASSAIWAEGMGTAVTGGSNSFR